MAKLALVVDDDEDFLNDISDLVEFNFDTEVELKTLNSRSALEDFIGAGKKATGLPDIIFLDLKLTTKKEGFAALSFVKQHKRGSVKRIPIVMYSSSKSQSDIDASYEGLANSYVEKGPDQVSRLQQTLKHWIDTASLPT